VRGFKSADESVRFGVQLDDGAGRAFGAFVQVDKVVEEELVPVGGLGTEVAGCPMW
jgi:hypothetical protein